MSRSEPTAEKSLKSILKEISKGRSAPCYLLYGDEDFLVEEALGKLVDALMPEQDRDLNLFMIDDSGGVDPVCEALLTPPLIPGPKVVVLRKTRLLYSKTSLPELVRKIADNAEMDLPAAARAFMVFLDVVGWSLEQLRDDGWRRITDEQWNEVAGGQGAKDREKWFPRVLEYCAGQGMRTERPRAGGTEALEELLSSGLPEGHCLVITADSVDRRKRLFKVLTENGVVLAFIRTRSEASQRNLMMENLREKLTRKGKTLSPEAWVVLGKKTGFRLRDSAEALDMLITFTGHRKSIETADVETVIGRTRDDSVFDLTEAIVRKDLRKALASLGDLLYQGVHHLVILSMITREVRFLFHGKVFLDAGRIPGFRVDMDFGPFQRAVYPTVKELQSQLGKGGALASQHPYVVYNALRNATRFSCSELKDHLERVLAIDEAMKSTGQDPRLLLERLLIELCGHEATRG